MSEYNVIFREGNGVLTYSTYPDKSTYDRIGKLRGEPVEERVSEERAKKVCADSLERFAGLL